MSDLTELLETFTIKENPLIEYILQLNISKNIKTRLLFLIENDNYNDYIEIYNILLENDIEIPCL